MVGKISHITLLHCSLFSLSAVKSAATLEGFLLQYLWLKHDTVTPLKDTFEPVQYFLTLQYLLSRTSVNYYDNSIESAGNLRRSLHRNRSQAYSDIGKDDNGN